jgi:ABC-type multidrug transport system fused ATPase/permease subunit
MNLRGVTPSDLYKMKKYNINLIGIILVIILILTSYYTPLVAKPFSQDQNEIITPLEGINSFNDYFDSVKQYKIVDVQPVRDLSHILDIYIEKKTGYQSIGVLTNLVLLLLIALVLLRILSLHYSNELARFLTLLFVSHPIVFNVTIEITSRKHILSFYFFLLLFSERLTGNFSSYSKFKQGVFHLLSLLSQPITILIPIWFTISDLKSNKLIIVIKKYYLLYIISFVLGLLNIYYYDVVFFEQFGFAKNSFQMDLGAKILIMGRMFFQILLPVVISTQYDPASILAFAGIALLVVTLYFLYKKTSLEIVIKYILLAFIIFFTLYHKGSNIFFLNTYLLIPIFCLIMIIGHLFNIQKKDIKSFNYIIVLLFIAISHYYGSIRSSKTHFYDKVSDYEQDCSMIQAAVISSIHESEVEVFKRKSQIWLSKKCLIINKNSAAWPGFIMTIMIYFDESIPTIEKIELFEKRIVPEFDLKILKTFVEYQDNKISKDNIEILIDGLISKDIIGSPFYYNLIIFDKYLKECAINNSEICTKFEKHISKMKFVNTSIIIKN